MVWAPTALSCFVWHAQHPIEASQRLTSVLDRSTLHHFLVPALDGAGPSRWYPLAFISVLLWPSPHLYLEGSVPVVLTSLAVGSQRL